MPGSTRVRVVVVVVALVGAYAGYQWWTSPERQIRRTLQQAVSVLNHDEPDTSVSALSGVAGLNTILSIDVTVEDGTSDARTIRGRQDVVALAARVRLTTTTLRIVVFDERVSMTGPTSATVDMTVQMTMGDRERGEVSDARQVNIELEMNDGRWLVSRVRIAPKEAVAV